MLIRFGVRNFRSMCERQELSFVASPLRDLERGLIESRHVPKGKLLPAVVVYGANASGKTSLVRAIDWMRSAVLHSHSRGEPDKGVPISPFRLAPDAGDVPSCFDIDFVSGDVRYHYGFEATKDAYTSEWLLAFPNEKRQTLFEREGMQFRFGRNLRGRNTVISELTRPNSLFLSAAAQNAHEDLTKIWEYFNSITVGGLHQAELADSLNQNPADPRLINFLRAAGTGIVNYHIREHMFSDPKTQKFREGLNALFKSVLEEADPPIAINEKMLQLQLAHEAAGNTPVYFDLSDESQGTRWLLRLLVPVFRALDLGTLMIIDELDLSLHTLACELLLGLFASSARNPQRSQLLVTTHDTNLLCASGLRRDQVWFTEKDRTGGTHLYPLTDFRTRGSDNIERGYLQGRFGAVPFSGSADELLPTL